MARARGGGAGWVLLLVAAWVLWAAAEAAEASRSPAGRRVHRHLKRLNKPAVKSIEVKKESAEREALGALPLYQRTIP